MEMIPKAEPQKIPFDLFEKSVPNEGRWEWIGGKLLFSDDEIRKLILMLIGQIGLKKLIEILPHESKNELERLLKAEYR
ncbi:hypothetical protein CathTA2_0891 [Caldalkalibacillus thermarum TA2.A1]|jgi:hypothetical protein|uniref:Uncharacterized protein n=1 Tax=Caldalkalibacillus thermarum (strain TA2.A1) TaxID=986075 RepID=F5L528_CALTT|nr:hypothetical protein [Caldalkalibacillus thermarum]EGL83565.1 hypothetical protein CathTA2_0891 [Caldalkalibacillus thermarum TA2.A1]QZT34499.1 hypothetical protein HUR95_03720 [Caldalkalibacillus thermarum TA2.A1]GGK31217.1 hypothetical protein GCM10010965_25000 [Caldalkalibacillus thermarum]